MAETPSAGSTTGIKSGFVGRKVWKEVSAEEDWDHELSERRLTIFA